MNTELEKQIVENFIQRKRQDRFLWMIESSKRWKRIFDDLRDTRYFEERATEELSGQEKFSGPIVRKLKSLGIRESIYLICSEEDLDGTFQSTEEFIEDHLWEVEEVIGYCPISKIGFFKNHEAWFYILRKPANKRLWRQDPE